MTRSDQLANPFTQHGERDLLIVGPSLGKSLWPHPASHVPISRTRDAARKRQKTRAEMRNRSASRHAACIAVNDLHGKNARPRSNALVKRHDRAGPTVTCAALSIVSSYRRALACALLLQGMVDEEKGERASELPRRRRADAAPLSVTEELALKDNGPAPKTK